MISVQELLKEPPDHNQNLSRWMHQACVEKVVAGEWVLYDSYFHSFVEPSVNRFLNSHSTIPNPFNDKFPMEGVRPMGVCYIENTVEENGIDSEIYLFLYLNGAVSYYRVGDGVPQYQLFIEERLVGMWGYPNDYLDKESIQKLMPKGTKET